MPTMKQLVEAAKKPEHLKPIVVGPHTRYLETPEAQRPSTPEAIEFITRALQGEFKHPRPGRFSPSSIGGCPRKLLFGFVGAPEAGENVDAADLMGLGTWGHLRWQFEGLSMGYMTECEVWTIDPARRIGGSIDAMLYDDSVFELKTAFGPKFSRLVQIEKAPAAEHRMQFQAYSESEGVESGSIVYEDRGTGNYFEFRVEPDEAISRQLNDKLEMLNNQEADDVLPPMLEDCERKGPTYQQCQFRKWCPNKTRVWEGIEK